MWSNLVNVITFLKCYGKMQFREPEWFISINSFVTIIQSCPETTESLLCAYVELLLTKNSRKGKFVQFSFKYILDISFLLIHLQQITIS